VSIIALVKGQVVIVKTSLIGSILSNLLLVMGMSFFFGGFRRIEQFFNQTLATTAASMLALAIAGVIIPTAFDKFTATTNVPIAELSRGTAIILLVVYGCYLYFQLKTHSAMYAEESQKVPIKSRKQSIQNVGGADGSAVVGAASHVEGGTDTTLRDQQEPVADKQEPDGQKLHLAVAVFTLAASTALVSICAEFMVDSISSITSGDNGISIVFVGLILLPIIGNASEHISAVTVACKDKMDLSIGIALGSSMQIALLIIPFIVILGWILGNDDMNLSFDGFQIVVLFVSVLLVNYLISDGKSNWLEGVLLQSLYLIIAVTYVAPIPPILRKVTTKTPQSLVLPAYRTHRIALAFSI
jgi:Ca2+:H+ antiporter